MIIIPDTINVGFVKRDGTVDGKLSYVTYTDSQGKLRKETSWNQWRNEAIKPLTLSNTPVSGLKLNYATRGQNYGWDSRQAFIRVYDQRGFEFEIDTEVLVHLLKNGGYNDGFAELVYGWSTGGRLILVPTASPDYTKIVSESRKVSSNDFIKAADLQVGKAYVRKSGKKSVYLGKLQVWKNPYPDWRWHAAPQDKPQDRGLMHVFHNYDGYDYFSTLKSVSTTFIAEEDPDWAAMWRWDNKPTSMDDLLEIWARAGEASPIDKSMDQRVYLTIDDLKISEHIDNAGDVPKRGRTIEFYCANERKSANVQADGRVFFRKDAVGYRTYSWSQETSYDYYTPEEFITKFNPYRVHRYYANGRLYGVMP